MEKFGQLSYEHIDFDKASKEALQYIEKMQNVGNFNAFKNAVHEFDKLYRRILTHSTLCEIRHSLNTADSFYSSEQDYYDKNMPVFDEFLDKFCSAMLHSEFEKEICDEWGRHTLKKCEYRNKRFSPEIVKLMQEENSLASEYERIMSNAKINFDGKTLTLPGLMKYFGNDDRQVRRAAVNAFDEFLQSMETTLDDLFDKMVKIRTQMGKTMGFENFVPLGYIRMQRYDYNSDDVKNFREEIKKYIVPLNSKLIEKQAERIGVEALMYYDLKYEFPDGNAEPCGNSEELKKVALNMYNDLSPECSELFNMMYEADLLDLESRNGKIQGGYCTSLPDYKVPFVFANFNKTADDVETLTHEVGHALNDYLTRNFDLFLQNDLSYETAEIHSTSMEYFTLPYMDKFFGKDADKYRFSHLSGTLSFMAYEACVDEFQHIVYSNPDMTPSERKHAWHELEETYLPYYKYDENQVALKKGCYWYRQLHIFTDPFYYIDYALASFAALELYEKSLQDRPQAWKSYIKICQTGGKLPFRTVLSENGLSAPFEKDAFKKIIQPLYKELNLDI